MSKAIRIHANGGPEVLAYEDADPGQPGEGQILIRHTAIGLNFIDVYYRSGLYPPPGGLPLIPGSEAAGVVLALGTGVDWLKPGDRIAYAVNVGAYAEQRVIAADRVVKVPDGISDEQAAAMMLKGMTAEYLLRRTFPVKAGDTILYHAAAGGVGLILGQWAKHLGAIVIGTASSADKIELARAHGFDHVINYKEQDFVAGVAALTGGKKCDVVYDSVGADTFPASLDCLRPLGMFVSFGSSSGPVPPFPMSLLAQKGSLYATRPTLFVYNAKREDLVKSAEALFDVVKSGAVEIKINQRYALKDAGKAQADLEARKTTGTTVLIP
ncbi:NADPH:quinone reductase [Mesorhizobium sp. M2A.F.Ca.ET.037.01.1.1]|uniref:quinone oxidoreductase family protein n=4 Tax=Mesorhizobium TaxID=68287 RepID=UPI000F75AE94|nr:MULTISPECIES: quinone oxidoreductase [unclassified Mesorhizobium]RVC68307.1 NADPH:quinone reductase [Mesorhizobium sp. M00.F.Ca.ET.038.03.1.1]RVC75042.1 NADPH:quinone reductase [Mesorhizobium sp. M2A.F.Ca.ET.046.02.1.1]AZO07127.1 quinone oxidoreductase [Mesorhizobium sp. M2A.F.Ca.ET.043.02.1.1]AZO38423.1 quinone oxidoreductase [Mesorhizobium sp. M2A.F.Ca.ET.046.03.2.1]RUW40759.1 NADPH:quinone reductase [Mesorhizobium sp. M2A.F.Ca.ET.015.02.1.1]